MTRWPLTPHVGVKRRAGWLERDPVTRGEAAPRGLCHCGETECYGKGETYSTMRLNKAAG